MPLATGLAIAPVGVARKPAPMDGFADRFAMGPADFQNPAVARPDSRFGGARDVQKPIPGGGRRRPDSAGIQDLFLSRLDALEERVSRELGSPGQAAGPFQEFLFDAAREAWRLGSSGFQRVVQPSRIARALALLTSAAPTDELGVDERAAVSFRHAVRAVSSLWLSLDAEPETPLPHSGPVLVTFNRSAWPLPAEAVLLWSLVADAAAQRRDVYVLWQQEVLELAFVGERFQRLGILASTRANLRTLLERGALVVAFPEGNAATAKTYDRRYRLARFEDSFVFDEARSAGARIVPGAVIGNEESFPVLGHVGAVPITPFFPSAGLLGLSPLPLAWRVRLGAPVEYAGGPFAGDSSEAPAVDGLQDAVRARMQAMLGELLAARRSIVFG